MEWNTTQAQTQEMYSSSTIDKERSIIPHDSVDSKNMIKLGQVWMINPSRFLLVWKSPLPKRTQVISFAQMHSDPLLCPGLRPSPLPRCMQVLSFSQACSCLLCTDAVRFYLACTPLHPDCPPNALNTQLPPLHAKLLPRNPLFPLITSNPKLKLHNDPSKTPLAF